MRTRDEASALKLAEAALLFDGGALDAERFRRVTKEVRAPLVLRSASDASHQRDESDGGARGRSRGGARGAHGARRRPGTGDVAQIYRVLELDAEGNIRR